MNRSSVIQTFGGFCVQLSNNVWILLELLTCIASLLSSEYTTLYTVYIHAESCAINITEVGFIKRRDNQSVYISTVDDIWGEGMMSIMRLFINVCMTG